jgi:hypothetical protein
LNRDEKIHKIEELLNKARTDLREVGDILADIEHMTLITTPISHVSPTLYLVH